MNSELPPLNEAYLGFLKWEIGDESYKNVLLCILNRRTSSGFAKITLAELSKETTLPEAEVSKILLALQWGYKAISVYKPKENTGLYKICNRLMDANLAEVSLQKYKVK